MEQGIYVPDACVAAAACYVSDHAVFLQRDGGGGGGGLLDALEHHALL